MAVQIMLEVDADRRASLHSYLHALKGMRKIGGVQSVQVIVWKDFFMFRVPYFPRRVRWLLESDPSSQGRASTLAPGSRYFPEVGWLGGA